MDDLVQWLGEQLDEEAELAASGETWSMFPEGDFGTPRVDVDHSIERVVAATRAWRAKHIAAHDPARVLREIEAKRDLLRLAAAAHDYHETFTSGFASALEGTLRLFALAYADRPGFREEWRP